MTQNQQKSSFTVVERSGKLTVSSGSAWEPKIGYSRAVKKGNMIFISGCVGIEADKTFSPHVAQQTRRSLAIIQSALEALGASMADVVMTRMYLTNIKNWEQVALAHGELFGEIRPATVMVEVSKLIDDAALIEIEATAMVG
jgi:enamine deaminase RidA (YjgF/YER057c/UK114 family)